MHDPAEVRAIDKKKRFGTRDIHGKPRYRIQVHETIRPKSAWDIIFSQFRRQAEAAFKTKDNKW
jgi:hypothetical protein